LAVDQILKHLVVRNKAKVKATLNNEKMLLLVDLSISCKQFKMLKYEQFEDLGIKQLTVKG
jgi:3-methyladenine DNA glycosylase Tag